MAEQRPATAEGEHLVQVNETVSYNIQFHSIDHDAWLTEKHRKSRSAADMALAYWRRRADPRYYDGVRLQKVTVTTVRTEQVL